jgi:hypothetical protein
MSNLTTSGTSGYATGSIDTVSVLVNNVSPIDAKHPNGLGAAVIQIETILGSGTTLKGSKTDLGARLAVSITSAGLIDSPGVATLNAESAGGVLDVLTLKSTTSGTPTNLDGTGVLFLGESADENPGNMGRVAMKFSDVTAGSEDTFLSIFLRVAGAAIAEAWGFAATNAVGSGFLTHANTGARTYTFQDSSDVIVGRNTTDTLTNKSLSSPTITGNTVGTGALKTATGSATGSGSSSVVNITMNDYSFSPNIQNTSGDPVLVHAIPAADSSTEVGRFGLALGAGGSGYTVRWRYVTASDDPVIWVLTDMGGVIVGVWASDDPLPGGVAGLEMPGHTSTLIKPSQLEQISVLSTKADEAEAYIMDRKLDMANQSYRALQLLAQDRAPSKWLLDNCSLEGGKLVSNKK